MTDRPSGKASTEAIKYILGLTNDAEFVKGTPVSDAWAELAAMEAALLTEVGTAPDILERLVKSLPPIIRHATFSMDRNAESPSSHQDFIRQDRDDLHEFQRAYEAARNVLWPARTASAEPATPCDGCDKPEQWRPAEMIHDSVASESTTVSVEPWRCSMSDRLVGAEGATKCDHGVSLKSPCSECAKLSGATADTPNPSVEARELAEQLYAELKAANVTRETPEYVLPLLRVFLQSTMDRIHLSASLMCRQAIQGRLFDAQFRLANVCQKQGHQAAMEEAARLMNEVISTRDQSTLDRLLRQRYLDGKLEEVNEWATHRDLHKPNTEGCIYCRAEAERLDGLLREREAAAQAAQRAHDLEGIRQHSIMVARLGNETIAAAIAAVYGRLKDAPLADLRAERPAPNL